ncbi:DNA glycosylase AlkZ-like family protein [Microbacterium sp. TWP3-1-2b2]|uniref:DNA glycosylase AlkZ-like family protein n=1 Tax=Microbacterium sp. TWP3-1-2b2 TaxID=2804651 RepID=UPI003CF42B3A
MTHQLTRGQARRLVLRAQALDADRPGDVVEVAERLGAIKIDPTAVIASCEHTVLWSRIGWGYETTQLRRAVEDDRMLFEFDGAFRPMSLLPLMLPAMRRWPTHDRSREWLAANEKFRREVLAHLRAEGPLMAGDIPDTAQVRRAPDGWYGPNQAVHMLEFLMRQGEVAITRREGRQRVWDLAERVYPKDLPEYGDDEVAHLLEERHLQAAGIAKPHRHWNGVGEEAGEPATVEGSRWKFRVDPVALAVLERDEPGGRASFLNPYDSVLYDRGRLTELFDFTYVLEQFKRRIWCALSSLIWPVGSAWEWKTPGESVRVRRCRNPGAACERGGCTIPRRTHHAAHSSHARYLRGGLRGSHSSRRVSKISASSSGMSVRSSILAP